MVLCVLPGTQEVSQHIGQCCSESAEVGNGEEPTHLFMPGQVKEGQDRGQEDTIQTEPWLSQSMSVSEPHTYVN